MRQTNFPGAPGKAVPSPGSRPSKPPGPRMACVSTPKPRQHRLTHLPARARCRCPCIALLGYSRRGRQPVGHLPNGTRPRTGACASCPWPCVCAGTTQVMAACIRLVDVDVCDASRRVPLRCYPTLGGLRESLRSGNPVLARRLVLRELCLAHWAALSLCCCLKIR